MTDLSRAFRSLRRAPAFTWAAVWTVALGAGVNVGVFTVVYQVLLDPLPYREPAQLVHVGQTHPEFPAMQVAAPDYFDWRRINRSFSGMTLLVKGTAPARELQAALRAASPEAMIKLHGPLDALRAEAMALRRFALELLLAFAALAAVLTVVGVYGVVSYSLAARGREFAIRFALGAAPAEVRRVLMRQCAGPALAGLAAGLWLAWVAGRALQSQLYGVSAGEPLVLALAVLALVGLLALAAWRPAARAAAVSPSALLRQ